MLSYFYLKGKPQNFYSCFIVLQYDGAMDESTIFKLQIYTSYAWDMSTKHNWGHATCLVFSTSKGCNISVERLPPTTPAKAATV